MKIVMRKPGELKPYEKNAKKHDARQIDNVANSIKRFGWQQPIVVDENDVVVIGHCRLLAAKKLGLAQVPVTVASGLTEDEIKELRIADNKTNESPWDFGLLVDDMKGLDFGGFDFGFGFGSDGFQPVQEEPQEQWTPPVNDEGFAQMQEPLSQEELAQYEQGADEFLMKRRVIITYMPEQEEEVKQMLGITDERMRVVYDFDTLFGNDEE